MMYQAGANTLHNRGSHMAEIDAELKKPAILTSVNAGQNDQPETVVLHVHRQEGPQFSDSIEIGSPSKGGAIKVYVDISMPGDAKRRLENAFAVRAHAQRLLSAGYSSAGGGDHR